MIVAPPAQLVSSTAAELSPVVAQSVKVTTQEPMVIVSVSAGKATTVSVCEAFVSGTFGVGVAVVLV